MSDGGPSRAIVLRDEGMVATIGASATGRVIGEAFASGGAKVHITELDEAAVGVRALFDGLDVLVNNVGVAGSTGSISVDADVECL